MTTWDAQAKHDVRHQLHEAKNALLSALRIAEREGAPKALREQIDTLCARAEVLENRL